MARDYWFAFGGGNPATNSGLAPTFITFMNDLGTGFAAPSITEIASKGLYLAQYGATTTITFTLDGATTGLVATDRYIAGVFDPYDLFGATLNSVYGLGTSLIALGNSNIALGNSNIAIGNSNIALGNSNIALGTTNIFLGSTGIANWSAFGSSLTAQGVTLTGIGSNLSGIGLSLSTLGLAIGTTASSYGSTSVDPVDVMGFLKRAQEMAEGNKTYTKATGLLDYFIRGGATLLREKTVSDTSTSTTTT